MNIAGKDYRTVWMEGASVFFIEQNLLPFRFAVHESRTCAESCHAIRTMQVRGAGAIGALAGFAMAQGAQEAPASHYSESIEQARTAICATRPTARNLFHAVERVYAAALISREAAVAAAQAVADRDAEDSRRIGEAGSELIRDGMRIETHCNAGWLAFVDYGTALSPLYRAHEQGKRLHVWVDETRPRSQGARLTAWELGQAGIPHVIIPDNAGAWLMSLGEVDLMIVGADRIAANGDTANKIGTLEKAIAARHYNIPFYIAAPTSTFDMNCPDGRNIPVEIRSDEEILFQEGMTRDGRLESILVSTPGSRGYNPAFDVTPAALITGIITEKGIIPAETGAIRRIMQ